MKKVKTFLQQLSYSLIPQTTRYETFLHNRFSSSFAFFLKSQLFFSFVIILLIFININPITFNTYRNYIDKSLNNIPTNLQITIYNGQLNSNLFRPFFFWLKFPKEKFLFLVIDEKAEPEKIKEYESSILLTKSFVAATYRKQLYTFSYPQFTGDVILTKPDILKMSTRLLSYISLLMMIASPLLVLLVPFVLFLITLTNIILSSIVVYIFYRFFNKQYKFIKIVQIGFYSSSLPIFIMIILCSLFLWNCIPIYSPFIIFLIFQLTGVFEAHYNKSNHALKHQPIHRHKI